MANKDTIDCPLRPSNTHNGCKKYPHPNAVSSCYLFSQFLLVNCFLREMAQFDMHCFVKNAAMVFGICYLGFYLNGM